jgi:hypothetical protein
MGQSLLPGERTSEDIEEGLSLTKFLRLVVCGDEGLKDRLKN